MKSVAILTHLYYEHAWMDIVNYINKVETEKFLYFNVVHEKHVDLIKASYPDANITVSENRGADIGGFFSSIDAWLKDGFPGDLMIKLHTKGDGNWRRDLCDPIFNNLDSIFKAFDMPKLGMVGSKRWLCHASGYTFVDEYCKRFGLKKDPIYFFGGTIFCVRSDIVRDFFLKYDPIMLKNELEPAKPGEPSRTHAWERLLGQIITGDYFLTDAANCSMIQDFDEDYYLASHDDVKKAVKAGKFASGFQHYIINGINENRPKNGKIFDENYYLEKNPDVAEAIKFRNEFSNGYHHYLMHGRYEKRDCLWIDVKKIPKSKLKFL